MSYDICVVSGSRAEYDLLKPLLKRIYDDSDFDLSFVLTGSHLDERFGNTGGEIDKGPVPVAEMIPLLAGSDDKHGMAKAIASAVSGFSDYFDRHSFDLLLILGDRFEIFGTAVAAAVMGVPIAHLYGGDTTEGAADEFMRHSITKMSFLHFTSGERYRERVIQLGESPDRVFNVGSLGVENALNLPLMSLAQLERDLGFKLEGEKYAVVTYHPVTLENATAESRMEELIAAMDSLSGYRFIVTGSNADAGGLLINEIWEREAKKRENWYFTPSLGAVRYLSALKYSVCMLGNSSSGISEAPSLKVPTVNIGDRQKGRIMAESVISCDTARDEIVNAVRRAEDPAFRESIRDMESPFGDGHTSKKTVEIIKSFLSSNRIDLKKKFYDLNGLCNRS